MEKTKFLEGGSHACGTKPAPAVFQTKGISPSSLPALSFTSQQAAERQKDAFLPRCPALKACGEEHPSSGRGPCEGPQGQPRPRALTQMRSCSSTTFPLRHARCSAVRPSPSPQVSFTSSREPWASSRITVRRSSSAVALSRCCPRESSRHCRGARKSFCSYLARIQSSFSSLGKPEGTGHSHHSQQREVISPFQIYVKKALIGTAHPNLVILAVFLSSTFLLPSQCSRSSLMMLCPRGWRITTARRS